MRFCAQTKRIIFSPAAGFSAEEPAQETARTAHRTSAPT